MKKFKEFDIPFAGLKQGEHRFEHRIDNLFFEGFDYTDFNDASLKVDIVLHKKINMLEFGFSTEGTVNVNCDLSNEPFDLKIGGALDLIVKFGEEYNDENEEVLVLPHGEHHVNVAQYIYEMAVLSVPVKKIHPGVEDGSMDSEILRKLEELQPGETKTKREETDPRWDTLKKLLTDK
ncbi:DUF177 domain-containing protein [Sinomicrobium kalidii]|uniref:YceD family protein n=1 Tax=Sinomicrobium kalidii TaxID=2900738 RepID=UPI001E4BD91C|nr:DUF177 domain-containing protein [Sinomicrobium kalidii]UGU18266.1 DUF177 domain-containing protein [Sinomicrobium kalidii]